MVECADDLVVPKDDMMFTMPVSAVANSHMQGPDAWACVGSTER